MRRRPGAGSRLVNSVKYYWLYMIGFAVLSFLGYPYGVLSVLVALLYTTWVVVPLHVPQAFPWIKMERRRGRRLPVPCTKTVLVRNFTVYAYGLAVAPLVLYLGFWYVPLSLAEYLPLIRPALPYIRVSLALTVGVPVYMAVARGAREPAERKTMFVHPTDYFYYKLQDYIDKIAGVFRVDELWHKSGMVIEKSDVSYKKYFIAWFYAPPVALVFFLIFGWEVALATAVIMLLIGLYPVYALHYAVNKRRDNLRREYIFLLLSASPIIRLGASIEDILRKAGGVGLEQMRREYRILQYYCKLYRGFRDPVKDYYIPNIPYDRMRVLFDGYYSDLVAGADPTKLFDSEVKYMVDRYERSTVEFVSRIKNILVSYVEIVIVLVLASIVVFMMYPGLSLLFLGFLGLASLGVFVVLVNYIDRNQPYMKFWVRYGDALKKAVAVVLPVFVATVVAGLDPSYVAGLSFFTFMFVYGYYVRNEFALINDELTGIQTFMMLLNDYFLRGRLPVPSVYEMVREFKIIQNKHFTLLVREAVTNHRMGRGLEPVSMRSWFVKMIFRVLSELNVGTHGVRTAMNLIVNNVTTIVNALFDLRKRLKMVYAMIVGLNIALYLISLMASGLLLQTLPMLTQLPGVGGWTLRYSGATVAQIAVFQYILKVFFVVTAFVQSLAIAKAESGTIHNTLPVAFTVLALTLSIMLLDITGLGVSFIQTLLNM